MKRFLLFLIIILILLLFVTSATYADDVQMDTLDYETVFEKMEIEELEDVGALLQRILNQKKIGNAKLLFEESEKTIAIGIPKKLVVKSDQREITKKTKITYISSDDFIAIVENGSVSGVNPGTATIRALATFEDGANLEAECTIHVVVPVKSIKRPNKNISILAGKTVDVASMISVLPDNATEKGLIYSVDNEKIATVDEHGILKGIKVGKGILTITSADSVAATVSIKIPFTVNQPVTSIKFQEDYGFGVPVGDSRQYAVSVYPENATNKKLTWTSKDPSIVTVSGNGTVKGLKQGSAYIECASNDGSGLKVSKKINVYLPVKNLSVTKEILLSEGESIQIDVKATPEEGKYDWDWESEDTSIATVSKSGVVTAKSVGSCEIITSCYPSPRGVSEWGRWDSTIVTVKRANASSSIKSGSGKSILNDSRIKNLIKTCPTIGTSKQRTIDYYDSRSSYEKAFPKANSSHTWRITIQGGIYMFSDENDTQALLVKPDGKPSELIPVLKWEISLLEKIPELKEYADRNGITLIAEKRVVGEDYASYADSNGVINLLDSNKYNGLLEKEHSILALLEVIDVFGEL